MKDPKKRTVIVDFDRNVKLVNYIILNELLNSRAEFKNINEETKKNLLNLIKLIFKERSIVNIMGTVHGKFVYADNEYTLRLADYINSLNQISADILAENFFKELFEEKPKPTAEFQTIENRAEHPKMEAHGLQAQYNSSIGFFNNMFTEFQKYQTENETLKTNNKEYLEENAALEYMLTEKEDTAKDLTSYIESLKTKNVQLQAERDQLETSLKEKDTKIVKLSTNILDSKGELEKQQKAYSALQQSYDLLKTKVTDLQQGNQELTNQLTNAATNSDKFKKLSDSRKRKIEELEKEKKSHSELEQLFASLKQQYIDLQSRNAELSKINTGLQESLNIVSARLEVVSQDNGSRAQKILELEAENTRLKKQNNGLKKQKTKWDNFEEMLRQTKDDAEEGEEESNSSDDSVKKNFNESNEELKKFDVFIEPHMAADLYFNKYKNPDAINIFTNSSLLYSFTGKNINDIIGFWGEEAIGEFFEKKYGNKYHTIVRSTPYGFELDGFKRVEENGKTSICSFTISVEFPNKGQYEQAKSGKYSKKTGDYDIKVTKKVADNCAIPEKWLKEQRPSENLRGKIRFIEVKTTPRDVPSYAFFTKKEHLRMNTDKDRYRVYRVYAAGNEDTDYKKITDVAEGLEIGKYDYELKIKL